jgi:hypothetical protein
MVTGPDALGVGVGGPVVELLPPPQAAMKSKPAATAAGTSRPIRFRILILIRPCFSLCEFEVLAARAILRVPAYQRSPRDTIRRGTRPSARS